MLIINKQQVRHLCLDGDCLRKQAGFTLIEIMIAMAIVAVGVVAVMTATAKNVEITAELERRTIASWVVSNRFAEVRHSTQLESVSPSSKNSVIDMGGYEWQVKTVIEESSLDRVYLVTIEAREKNQTEKLPLASMVSSVADKR